MAEWMNGSSTFNTDPGPTGWTLLFFVLWCVLICSCSGFVMWKTCQDDDVDDEDSGKASIALIIMLIFFFTTWVYLMSFHVFGVSAAAGSKVRGLSRARCSFEFNDTTKFDCTNKQKEEFPHGCIATIPCNTTTTPLNSDAAMCGK